MLPPQPAPAPPPVRAQGVASEHDPVNADRPAAITPGVAPVLGERAAARVGTEAHAVYAVETPHGVEVVINPNPRILVDYIADLRAAAGTGGASADVHETLARVERCVQGIQALFAKKPLAKAEPAFTKVVGSRLHAYLKLIAQELGKLPAEVRFRDAPVVRPPSEIVYKPAASVGGWEVGTGASAWLSTNPGPHSGSPPGTRASGAWSNLNTKLPSLFVRGHIINKHVYGTGDDNANLAPISDHYNRLVMSPKVEEVVKRMVLEENRVVFYKVDVEYNGHSAQFGYSDEDLRGIPTAMTFTVRELVPEPGKKITALAEADPQPAACAGIVDLRLPHPLPKADTAVFKKNSKKGRLLAAAAAKGQQKLAFPVLTPAHASSSVASQESSDMEIEDPMPSEAQATAPLAPPRGEWARLVTMYFKDNATPAKQEFGSVEYFLTAASWYIEEELSETLADVFREAYAGQRHAGRDHDVALEVAAERLDEEWGLFHQEVNAAGDYRAAFDKLWNDRDRTWFIDLFRELAEEAASS